MQRDTLTQEPYRSEVRPQQEEDTIDLLELCMGLLDHWKFIAAAAAAGAVLAALYTFLLVTPLYKATSTIYVVSRNDSVLNLSDIQIGSALTSDYIKVFEMWEVHEKVISALDLDYTYTQMDNMLSVTNANDTRMLDITVTDADPEEAAAIANEYAEVGASYIAEKMKTDEPTIMSSARVPANPFSPSKTKNILLGFLAGFVLACGGAGLCAPGGWHRAQKGQQLPAPHEAPEQRYLPPCGRKGREERMKQLKITKFPELDYAGSEAFNTLSTNLSFAGETVKKIMITSCHASEGKSYLSMNLMRTLAQRGMKVALVDADLRRSMINAQYGLQFENGRNDDKGLSHFLAGMVGMEEVIYQTDIPGALMVPVGRDVPNPLALLSNHHFKDLLDTLAQRVDYVLVDAAPVGVVIDAAEIAKSCDGTLIAVQYNDVRRQELLDVKQQIEQSGCPILGTVLNQVDYDSYLSRKYYYRTYGKYGYYNRYYKHKHTAEKK